MCWSIRITKINRKKWNTVFKRFVSSCSCGVRACARIRIKYRDIFHHDILRVKRYNANFAIRIVQYILFQLASSAVALLGRWTDICSFTQVSSYLCATSECLVAVWNKIAMYLQNNLAPLPNIHLVDTTSTRCEIHAHIFGIASSNDTDTQICDNQGAIAVLQNARWFSKHPNRKLQTRNYYYTEMRFSRGRVHQVLVGHFVQIKFWQDHPKKQPSRVKENKLSWQRTKWINVGCAGVVIGTEDCMPTRFLINVLQKYNCK